MAPETSGSPLYMPPELLKVIRLMQLNFYSKPFNEYIFSSIVLNKRFKYDIWALGIVINIILYNRYPFDVKPVIDMPAVNIYNSEIRTPDFSHLNDTLVPKQYNDILRKMLEVDPSKRASASELVKMI